ncbi:MAG: SpoIID/LytB domain-containing protein [Massiliimalia sp.]
MKKNWLKLTGVLCAALVFSSCAVFAAGHIEDISQTSTGIVKAEDIQKENAASATEITVDMMKTAMFPQVTAVLPDALVYSEEDALPATSGVSAADEIKSAVEAPAPIKPSSSQNVAIEQDMSGTANANTVISSGTGKPLDDTPETSQTSSEPESSQVSSSEESTSAEGSSESSSQESSESQAQTGTTQNELETLLGMPSYTPYGKTLTIKLNGVTYKADAVVVVSGMVQSEMVGSGGSSVYNEAYKAQAVACHSYVKCNNNKGIAPSVYARHPSESTVRLVEQVIGQMVYYNGSVAETVYCASSGLHTQGNQYYWGGSAVPYLQGVVSKYDEDNSTKTFTVEEMRTRLNSNGYDTSSDPSQWFQILEYSDGGFISKVSICGKVKSGMSLHYLLNLKSAKAQIYLSDGVFTFATNGFGHGIGMSQRGAMGYARYEGWSYTQILNHYYPGTSVQ